MYYVMCRFVSVFRTQHFRGYYSLLTKMRILPIRFWSLSLSQFDCVPAIINTVIQDDDAPPWTVNTVPGCDKHRRQLRSLPSVKCSVVAVYLQTRSIWRGSVLIPLFFWFRKQNSPKNSRMQKCSSIFRCIILDLVNLKSQSGFDNDSEINY